VLGGRAKNRSEIAGSPRAQAFQKKRRHQRNKKVGPAQKGLNISRAYKGSAPMRLKKNRNEERKGREKKPRQDARVKCTMSLTLKTD